MQIRIRLEGGSGGKTIATRRQLTDEQWKLIEPFLPIAEYGPYPERLRDQFEGVIRRFRTGAQWREMPAVLHRRHPPPGTVTITGGLPSLAHSLLIVTLTTVVSGSVLASHAFSRAPRR